MDFGPSAGFDAIANGGTATNADPASPQPEPEAVYATWRDVADAVESGKLEGEGFLPSGTGAVADPYIIKTPEALAWFACLRPQAAARLAADIDLTSATYAEGGAAPAWPGDATLTGSLDGDGHAVLFATTGAGLFAEIAETGSASWLYLGRTDRQAAEAAEQGKPATAVTTTNTRAGALAGTNKGAVTGVVNRMDVSVTNDTDVPANQKPADPSAQAFAGGIVAVNDGTIADCANLGSVANAREAGQSAAAGIAAAGTGTIATSYNAGNVSAQAAAPLAAPFARDAQAYATAVDAASAYLADATYQGIAEQHAALAAEAAGAETPALDAAALAAASERLNAGREGDAAVWSAAGQDMRDFPAPAKPADPGTNVVSQTVDAAAPEATLKSETVETEPVARNGAPIRAKSVASWQVPDASQYAYAPFVVESPEVQGRQLAVSGADALSNMTAEAAAAVLLPKELVVEVAEEEEPQLVGPIVLDGATDPSNAANAAPGESGTPVVQNGEENTAGAQGSANQNAPPTTTETVPVTWTSADYDQATAAAQGTTFTAQLPAGYRLADGATPLAITVVPADQAGENAGAMPSDNDAAVVESWRLPTEEEGYDLASAAEATDQGITLALTDLSALADLSAEEAIAQLLPAQVRATVQVPGSANDAADAPATTITSESHIFDSANPDSDRNAASGETQEVALDVAWTATSYDNPAANGATFTAQLPEGYQLADGVTPLVVTVPPSEAATLDTAYSTWQEVGAAVEAGSITATASGQGSVKPTNIDEPDAGAAGNPYLINSPEALAWFMNKANADAAYRAKHVKLTADIDLTGSTYGGTPAEPLRWVAIGSQNAKYTGAFDGNGKTIDYMRILFTTETGVQGLFGYGGPGSVIKNVTVGSHSSVTSAGSDLAGIVGWLENGTVQNCRNEASVTTTAAGRGSHIAGIVGWGAVATIIGCVNAGDVTSLTGSPSYIGGIGGLGQWIVRDCYNIGTVRCDNSSDPKVSGICSGNNTSTDTCIIENSYNAGTLSAKNSSRTFGISVNTYAQVANCYYLGTSNAPAHGTSVTADQLATWGMPFLLNGRSVDGPWTVDDAASPANASRPVLALNLDGTAKNELPEAADWTEVGKWVNDFDPEYASGKKHKPEGNGTDDNPYRITTPEGLAWFAYATNAGKLGPTTTKKSAVIEADLDLTGAAYHRGSGALEWVPIGIGDVIYYGTFDGQGHAISNLSVTKLSDAVRYGPDGTDQNIKVAGLFGNAGSADVYLNNTFNNIVLESGSVGGDLAGVAADVPVFGGAVVGLFDGYAFGLKNRGVDVTFTLATPAARQVSAGGLIGSWGLIAGGAHMLYESYSKGNVTLPNLTGPAGDYAPCAGGLVGFAALRSLTGDKFCSVIAGSANGGTVVADGAASASGIAGAATGIVFGCTNYGTVAHASDDTEKAAGIVLERGYQVAESDAQLDIEACISAGPLSLTGPNGSKEYYPITKSDEITVSGSFREDNYIAGDVFGSDPDQYLPGGDTFVDGSYTVSDMRSGTVPSALNTHLNTWCTRGNDGAYNNLGAAMRLPSMTTAPRDVYEYSNIGEIDGFPMMRLRIESGTPNSWAIVGREVYNAQNDLTQGATHLSIGRGDPFDGTGVVGVNIAVPKIQKEGSTLLISTPEQLAWFAYVVNNQNATWGGTSVKLTADIDLTGSVYGGSVSSSAPETTVDEALGKYKYALPWTPIGSNWQGSNAYSGTFDGDGHAVSNLYCEQGMDTAGLIGSASNATVQNVRIASGVAYTKYDHGAGGLVGAVKDSQKLTVSNCFNNAAVSSGKAGGLVGAARSGDVTIERSGNSGLIVSVSTQIDMAYGERLATGGLLGGGESTKATVRDSYNTGAVNGCDRVGGLVGMSMRGSSFANCYSAGTIEVSSGYTPGLISRCEDTSQLTFANCSYDSTVLTGSYFDQAAAGVTARTTEEFASGKVANLLDTADVDGAASSPTVHRNVWGQDLARNAAGELEGAATYPEPGLGDDRVVYRGAIKNGSSTWDVYANNGRPLSLDESGALPPSTIYQLTNVNNAAVSGTFLSNPWTVNLGANLADRGDFAVTVVEPSWAGVAAGTDELTLRNTFAPGSTTKKALSGSGSSTDPYEISSPEALAWFAYKVNNDYGTAIANAAGAGDLNPASMTYGTAWAKLGANISLSGSAYGFGPSGSATDGTQYTSCMRWVPIAGVAADKPYAGTFDGAGFRISNLYISESDAFAEDGFFGGVGASGSSKGAVKNLTVTSGYATAASTSTDNKYLGAIAGYLATGTSLSGCSNYATVRTSAGYAGGLAGGVDGVTVEDCSNAGRVEGSNAGGLVGSGSGTAFLHCANNGAVFAQDKGGGFIGAGGNDTVTECYNAGAVSSAGGGAAVFIGWASYGGTFKITRSYNMGSVPGRAFWNTNNGGSAKTVTDSFVLEGASAVPSGAKSVTADQLRSWGAAYALSGGLSGGSDSSGAVTKMTAWRQAKDTNGDGALTEADENQGYPVLIGIDGANPDGTACMTAASDWEDVGAYMEAFTLEPDAPEYSSGSGWSVTTPEQLAYVAYLVNRKNSDALGSITNGAARIALKVPGNALSLAGERFTGRTVTAAADALEWVPIGVSADARFGGELAGDGDSVGKGTVIDYMYINQPDTKGVGLVGWATVTGSNVAISDIAIGEHSSITGNNGTGALLGSVGTGGVSSVGTNSLTIERCANYAPVYGKGIYTGGIAGYLTDTAQLVTINQCMNAARIWSEGQDGGYIGGIAAVIRGNNNKAIVRDCVNSGALDSSDATVGGGIVAFRANGCVIEDVLNTGSVKGGTGTMLGNGSGSLARGYYLTGTIDASGGGTPANGTLANETQLKTGEIAWTLDSKATNVSPRGVWGQTLARTGDGELDTAASDAIPILVNGADATVAGSTVPTVQRITYSYDTTAFSGQATTYGYANANTTVKLAPSPTTGVGCTYRLTNASGTILTNPYTNTQTGDFTVYVTTASDWAAVGAGQSEVLLKGTQGKDATGALTPQKALTGDGTSGNPYVLSSPEALAWFMHMYAANTSVYAKLGCDLSLMGTAATGSAANYVATGSDALLWNPRNVVFSGGLDGAGHTISDMRVNNTSGQYIGFFRQIKDATIQNLTLRGSLYSNQNYAGGLVGWSVSGGTATISNCVVDVAVDAPSYVGGFVGEVQSTNMTIKACTNLGTVKATGSETGGIVGTAHQGGTLKIENCLNRGNVTNTGSAGKAAGIFGRPAANLNGKAVTVTGCYSSAELSAPGGIVGVATPGTSGSSSITVTNSAYDATKAPAAAAGTGIVGVTTAELQSWAAAYYLNGGFTGGTDGSGKPNTMTAWRKAANASENDGMPVQLVNAATGAQEGVMDYAVDWSDVGCYVAAFNTAAAPAYNAASGWQIDSPEDLAYMAYVVNNRNDIANPANTALTYGESLGTLTGGNIDLTGARYTAAGAEKLMWIPIGTTSISYKGTFDGSGKTVDNLRIYYNTGEQNDNRCQGLFGYINGGTVRNVTVGANSSVYSTGHDLAGIVGWAQGGLVENCRNDANVTSTHGSHFAGIVGQGVRLNGVSPVIRGCVNTGTITFTGTAASYIGAIGGWCDFTIEDCYNTGAVISSSEGAKISGIASGQGNIVRITNCYNAGQLTITGGNDANKKNTWDLTNDGGTVTNSFYLADKAATHNKGTAVTDAQLKSGEVAWKLDTQDGTVAHRNVWGQTIKRDATGALQAIGTDAAPLLSDTADKADAPAVLRATFDYADAGGLTATYEYANAGSVVPLPVKTGAIWRYYSDAACTQQITAPYTIPAGTATDPTVYVLEASDWKAIGSAQTVAALQNAPGKNARGEDTGGKALAGSGTSGDPYVLSSPEALAWFMATYTATETHAKLGCDLSLAGTRATGSSRDYVAMYDAAPQWIPNMNLFAGSFDGAGHSVSGLRVNETANPKAGFFAQIKNAQIRNLTLKDGSVTSSKNYVAGLVGLAEVGGTNIIENCVVNLTVLTTGGYAGGLVGESNATSLIVRNCGNLGNVQANDSEASGVVGTAYAAGTLLIENCYNTGKVTATKNASKAGGIFGRAASSLSSHKVTVKGCYSSAILDGKGGTIGVAAAGGTSGQNNSITVSNCAFDTTYAPTAEAGTGVVGVTTEDLLTWGAAYYLNGGFTGGTGNTGNVADMTAWKMDTSGDNYGLPVPMVNNATGAPEGSMASAEDWNDVGAYVAVFHEGEPSYDSANGGWQVGTPEQLACVAYLVNNHNGDVNAADTSSRTYAESPLKLTESVDMTGARYSTSATATAPLRWTSLGERDDAPFAASFDGGLKVVTGLEAFGDSGGLIGVAGAPGVTVTELGVELAGSGIRGQINAGGLIGAIANGATATVADCYVVRAAGAAGANAKVLSGYAGGLVSGGVASTQQGTLVAANSYVAVPVETTASNGAVDAFSTAATTNATNCYYDSTVAGSATSSKAAARSTIVLQTPAMALALNNARADGPWTQTAVVNQSYPSFGTLTGVTWATVGQAQDEAALRAKDVTVDGTTVRALSGVGDQTSPYILSTPEALAWWAYQVKNSYGDAISNSDGANPATSVTYGASWATLGADMDLKGAAYGGSVSAGADGSQFETCLPWEPIAPSPGGSGSNNPYTGTFDGAGHTVSNMYATGNNRLGFFAGLGTNGVIKNLGIESGKVASATGSPVGGVLADITGNDARVSNCYNKAYVSGQYNIGGIVGRTNSSNSARAVIENCYNAGEVKEAGGNSAGGIIGKVHVNDITIENCYNTGKIAGSTGNNVGGIMGNRGGKSGIVFRNCYNAGQLQAGDSGQIYVGSGSSTTENCYYDSAIAGNAGDATGLTAAQLQTWGAAYALNGGFTGGDDGSGTINSMKTWRMAKNGNENAGMPVLMPIDGSSNEEVLRMDEADSWEDIGQYMDVFNPSTIPTYNAANGGWQVTTPEEFAYVAYTVNTKNAEPNANDGAVTYGNSSIALRVSSRQLDMKGLKYIDGRPTEKSSLTWTPMGKTSDTTAGAQEGYRFGGSLAGDPEGTGTPTTIDNLCAFDPLRGAYASGLIGWAAVGGQDMTISDIVIGRNSVLSSSGSMAVGAIVGTVGLVDAPVSTGTNKLTIERCSNLGPVMNTAQGAAVGGIAGCLNNSGQEVVVSQCSTMSIENSGTVQAIGRNSVAGGIAGQVGAGTEIRDCFVNTSLTTAQATTTAGVFVGSSSGATVHDCLGMPTILGPGTKTVLGTDPTGTFERLYFKGSFTDPNVISVTDDQLKSGEIGWKLDTQNGGAHRSVWGQTIARDALGVAQATGGDAAPSLRTLSTASAAPLVLRAAFDYSAAGNGAATYEYANPGSVVPLPVSTDAPWQYYADSAHTQQVQAPYALPENSTDDATVYVLAASDWKAIGNVQTADALKTTPGKNAQGQDTGTMALSGSGTDADPYVLSSPEALAWFMATYQAVNDAASTTATHVELGCDISLLGTKATGSAADYVPAGTTAADAFKWTPIAYKSGDGYFSGTFNGKGHAISGIRVDERERTGFFMSLNNATVENLTLEDGSITSGSYAASVANFAVRSTVQNCTTDLSVNSPTSFAGGVLAEAKDGTVTVKNCVNRGDVTGGSTVGGIVASTYSSNGLTIENCFNTGNLKSTSTGAATVGGIYGKVGVSGSANTTIKGCYSAGGLDAPDATTKTIAGIATADSRVTVSNCAFDATKASTATVGTGVVGATTEDLRTWGAAYYLNGGFTGGTASGTVTGMTAWRKATDGTENDGMPVLLADATTGASTGTMDAAANWGDVGQYVDVFDSASVPVYDAALGGWQVTSPEQLAYVAHTVNHQNATGNATAALAGATVTYGASDVAVTNASGIDLGGAKYTGKTVAAAADALEWVPMGHEGVGGTTASFTGSFNGNGHLIDHLYINQPDKNDVGLIGRWHGSRTSASTECVIEGVHIGSNSSIMGAMYTGAVIGNGYIGALRNCLNEAAVTGTDHVGGLAGEGDVSGISNCGNLGAVTATGSDAVYAAGVAAWTDCDTSACYNRGTVSALNASGSDVRVGGISGAGQSTISCYNTGRIVVPAGVVAAAIRPYAGESLVNCYYAEGQAGLSGTTTDTGAADDEAGRVQKVSLDNLKTWGAAYQLNRAAFDYGDAWARVAYDNVADMAVWRMASGDAENDGLPVLVGVSGEGFEQDGSTPATGMQEAANWGQVGAWVEAFDPYEDATLPEDGSGNLATTKIKPDTSVNDGSTEALAIQIASPEALAWYADRVNAGDRAGAHVALSGDLLLAGSKYLNGTDADARLQWSPIGWATDGAFTSQAFTGVFDGAGHEVDQLFINGASDFQGLFGYANGATFKNVGIGSRSSVKGASATAALAGGAYGSTLTNCWNRAAVTGANYAGGLAGDARYSNGTRCFNEGAVTATAGAAGGLFGTTAEYGGAGTLTDCFNRGDVTATGAAAGLVGHSYGPGSSLAFNNCYNAGTVQGGGSSWVLGKSDGPTTMSNCYYDPAVTVGTGGAGTTGLASKSTAEFATGQVAWLLDHPDAGGNIEFPADDAGVANDVWGQKLVRDPIDGTLQDATPLTGAETYPGFWDGSGSRGAGDFVDGTEHPQVVRVDYDFASGLQGKPAAMDAADLFLNAGAKVALVGPEDGSLWKYFRYADYTDEITENPYDTSGEALSGTGGYPVYVKAGIETWADVGALQNEDSLRAYDMVTGITPLAGTGAADDPYVLSTPEAFAWWAYQVNNKNDDVINNASGGNPDDATLTYGASSAALGADIDLSGSAYTGNTVTSAADALEWVPVGAWEYGGVDTPFTGSFNGNGHLIDHLYINQPDKDNVGLIGYWDLLAGAENVVEGVRIGSMSSVTGGNNTGGVLGFGGGTYLRDCLNEAAVAGAGDTGGVAGRSDVMGIDRCGNAGSVRATCTETSFVGGVTGWIDGQPVSCYNTGDLTVTSSNANTLVAGIAAYVNDGPISCYNAGAITATGAKAVAAIDAYGHMPRNCYYVDQANLPGAADDSGVVMPDEAGRVQKVSLTT